jgi:hypothetical protein
MIAPLRGNVSVKHILEDEMRPAPARDAGRRNERRELQAVCETIRLEARTLRGFYGVYATALSVISRPRSMIAKASRS